MARGRVQYAPMPGGSHASLIRINARDDYP